MIGLKGTGATSDTQEVVLGVLLVRPRGFLSLASGFVALELCPLLTLDRKTINPIF